MKIVVIGFIVFYLAFAAFFPNALAAPKNGNMDNVKTKMMNFNFQVDEFFDKIKENSKELLDGHDESIAAPAKKIFEECFKDDNENHKFRDLLKLSYRLVVIQASIADRNKKVCSDDSLKVVKSLKECISKLAIADPKDPSATTKPEFEDSEFVKALSFIIDRLQIELCKSKNLQYKIEIFERFRGNAISFKPYQQAFARFDELTKDCNKLKSDDFCLPIILKDAFEIEAIKSQAFTSWSRRTFNEFTHLYFTLAIKAPYKTVNECYKNNE